MADTPVIGIAGLGAMGLGIAQVFAQSGCAVRATDAVSAARDSAPERMRKALDRRVDAGKMEPATRDATLGRLTLVEAPEGLAGCELVIEAIIEEMDAKQSLFRSLEAVLAPDAVLATNTSSLSVTGLARGLERPGRLLGLHFFNPAPAMKLVELVRTELVDADALDRAQALTEAAGKTVIRCSDRPGFIVNRCARPFYGEALAIAEEGTASPGEIDAAMLAAGYRLGPFQLIDLVGADINLKATETVAAAMGGHPRYHVFETLRAQVDKGDLGRKSGRGFIHPDSPPDPGANAEAIVERIEAMLLNEAATLLEEGGVDEQGIDTALKLGLNFPRGPFEAGRARGPGRMVALLDRLEAAAPAHLKGRYAAADTLRQLAA
ncbi:3-hydroxybutyryl-CoA dehydrogenase [Rhodobacteraceae bacterium WD3A24]|nr:3-hydroxybutyryl-CoA dehydrogenase [Rhodobacteraceae bacterium WD3A24]